VTGYELPVTGYQSRGEGAIWTWELGASAASDLRLATCDLRLATCDLRLATCDLRLPK
jgi:hypothetical protein